MNDQCAKESRFERVARKIGISVCFVGAFAFAETGPREEEIKRAREIQAACGPASSIRQGLDVAVLPDMQPVETWPPSPRPTRQ